MTGHDKGSGRDDAKPSALHARGRLHEKANGVISKEMAVFHVFLMNLKHDIPLIIGRPVV